MIPIDPANTAEMTQAALNAVKEAERVAIRGVVNTTLAAVKKSRGKEEPDYEKKIPDDLHHLTSSELMGDLAGALEGKTGDAARQYLMNIKEPALKIPIK